jgi:4-azaleucine resistance transporter AzlC
MDSKLSEELHPGKSISPSRTFLNGVLQAGPIVFGYIPIGFAFGVLAQKAGISTANALLMSLLVFAGSAQLISVGLFARGVSPLSIVITTLAVNLRHMLMSAAMSPYLKGWRRLEIAAFTYELTDETFAIHAARFASGVPAKAQIFATNLTAQLSWILGTWLGTVTGQLVADVEPFGLDYALPAMFIALLVMQIKDRVQILVAVLTGLIATGLLLAGWDQWYVIAATLVGATIGLGMETWTKRQSS